MTIRPTTKLTTKLRTGLLLVFTAMTMAASLSGCLIETTGGGNGAGNCARNRYIQVSWSVAEDMNSANYTCNQGPAFSAVRLLTNSGSFEVGKACQANTYMGLLFDWTGSTDDATVDDRMVAGTYIISADLMAPDGVTSLSPAPGPGSQFQVESCSPLTAAFIFDLH
jgi:hypothetical protein